MKKLVIIASVFTVVIFSLIGYGLSISTTNREVDLRTSIESQQKKCKSYFDEMWKIISQDAEVANQYKEAFMGMIPQLVDGRKGSGEMFKFITESNPEFKIELYDKVMQAIEIQRTGFLTQQNILVDLNREHTALLHKIPSKWFLGGIKEIEIIQITSSKTEEVFQTGKEDNIDLFEKKDDKK